MDTNQDGDTDDIYGSAMDAAFEPKQKKKSSKKRSSWGSWFMTRRPGTEEILQKQLIALQAARDASKVVRHSLGSEKLYLLDAATREINWLASCSMQHLVKPYRTLTLRQVRRCEWLRTFELHQCAVMQALSSEIRSVLDGGDLDNVRAPLLLTIPAMVAADEQLQEVEAARVECDTTLQKEVAVYISARSLSTKPPTMKQSRAKLGRILKQCRLTYVAPAGNVAYYPQDDDIQTVFDGLMADERGEVGQLIRIFQEQLFAKYGAGSSSSGEVGGGQGDAAAEEGGVVGLDAAAKARRAKRKQRRRRRLQPREVTEFIDRLSRHTQLEYQLSSVTRRKTDVDQFEGWGASTSSTQSAASSSSSSSAAGTSGRRRAGGGSMFGALFGTNPQAGADEGASSAKDPPLSLPSSPSAISGRSPTITEAAAATPSPVLRPYSDTTPSPLLTASTIWEDPSAGAGARAVTPGASPGSTPEGHRQLRGASEANGGGGGGGGGGGNKAGDRGVRGSGGDDVFDFGSEKLSREAALQNDARPFLADGRQRQGGQSKAGTRSRQQRGTSLPDRHRHRNSSMSMPRPSFINAVSPLRLSTPREQRGHGLLSGGGGQGLDRGERSSRGGSSARGGGGGGGGGGGASENGERGQMDQMHLNPVPAAKEALLGPLPKLNLLFSRLVFPRIAELTFPSPPPVAETRPAVESSVSRFIRGGSGGGGGGVGAEGAVGAADNAKASSTSASSTSCEPAAAAAGGGAAVGAGGGGSSASQRAKRRSCRNSRRSSLDGDGAGSLSGSDCDDSDEEAAMLDSKWQSQLQWLRKESPADIGVNAKYTNPSLAAWFEHTADATAALQLAEAALEGAASALVQKEEGPVMSAASPPPGAGGPPGVLPDAPSPQDLAKVSQQQQCSNTVTSPPGEGNDTVGSTAPMGDGEPLPSWAVGGDEGNRGASGRGAGQASGSLTSARSMVDQQYPKSIEGLQREVRDAETHLARCKASRKPYSGYELASDIVSELPYHTVPLDMCICIMRCVHSIYESVRQISGDPSAFIGADDFFPLLVYVVVHSDLLCVHSTVRFISQFAPSILGTEMGYYLTSLEGAALFISNVTFEQIRALSDSAARLPPPCSAVV